MMTSLLIRRVVPLAASALVLLIASFAFDYLLHHFGLELVGRYLGVTGLLFFLVSFVYSARKKKIISTGQTKSFLRAHCVAGWIAALMVMVHSGIHYHALLPWGASALMLVVTASGYVGQHLVRRLRDEVRFQDAGAAGDAVSASRLSLDSLTLRTLGRWRKVHIPLVSFLLVLTLAHIATILMFSNTSAWWR